MNEIKQTLNILKNRWPEVTIIIGLRILGDLIILTLKIYPDTQTLLRLVFIGLSLLFFVLWLGFLRTVYLQQDVKQSIPDLARTGKHFFGRFFGLCAFGALAMITFFILVRIITGDFLSPLAIRIISPIIMLILAKLYLLLPAIIIVTDCSLPNCFRIMRKIELLKAKPLLIFFLIVNVVLPYLLLLLFPGYWETGLSLTWRAAIPALHSIILRIMGLMISVMAIRFVSSLEITNSQPIPDNNINL